MFVTFFAEAGSEECPQFDCREPKCWDSSTAYSTYVYLEDGTKCPGCKKCIWGRYKYSVDITSPVNFTIVIFIFKFSFTSPFKIISAHMRQANQ